ncbi:DDE-type integrase/transposase/recombinase [Suicoccus acidiformans]|uniref:DDE-type integrase/transposase/recombinase n=1 Tax=Suicoccus acidiformans TaxID=2036206 RepID=UPI0013C348FD|nr:DDE-type integrase/transposase/recombinase [Suicoccus acidiformans]
MGECTQETQSGETIKLYVICFVLSHSRHKYTVWKDHPFTTADAIEGHEKAFAFYGGRTEEIIYDQDRIISVDENAGNFVLTNAFQQYVHESGFQATFCRGAVQESKGKIESVVNTLRTTSQIVDYIPMLTIE